MLIECIGPPFVCRWPGGQVSLVPGQPVELPDDRALKLIAKVPGRVKAVDAPFSIRPGDLIQWQRAGGEQIGMVDFLHLDTDGIVWAFVSIGEAWAAVNLKFAKKVHP
jgi:hypothetical protein